MISDSSSHGSSDHSPSTIMISDSSSHVSLESRHSQFISRQITKSEHILLLIPMNAEMFIVFSSIDTSTRFQILMKSIRSFIWRKVASMMKHKISIATYSTSGDIHVCCNFTNNYEQLISVIDELTDSLSNSLIEDTCTESDPINIESLLNNTYDIIQQNETLISISESNPLLALNSLETSNVANIRCILIFGDSYKCPLLGNLIEVSTVKGNQLLKAVNFYCDILYIHIKSNAPNVICQDIFDALQLLIEIQNPKSVYVLENHHVEMKLNTNMALLLSHAFQREFQVDKISKLDFINVDY